MRRRPHPLGLGDLLSAAFELCTAHGRELAKVVFLVVLPVQLVAAAVLALTVSDPDTLNVFETDASAEGTEYVIGQVVVALLGGVSYLLATGACFHAIVEAWEGREPDWRESLRFAGRRAGPLLLVGLLGALGILVGFVACILPGVWLAIAWSVAYPVLFVEDRRGPEALSRSFALIKDRWWASFGVVALGGLIAGFAAAALTFGIGALAVVDDSLAFLIALTTLAGLLAAVLTMPFQAAIVTLLYFDLRFRKEGVAAPAPVPTPDHEWRSPAGWLPPRPD